MANVLADLDQMRVKLGLGLGKHAVLNNFEEILLARFVSKE
jgi:hypothetical protein